MFAVHFISALFTADVNWQVRRCHHSKEHRLDRLEQWNEKTKLTINSFKHNTYTLNKLIIFPNILFASGMVQSSS